MKREMDRYDLIGNIGLGFKDIKNAKEMILKFILFLLIICLTTAPSSAVSPHENQSGILKNKTCVDCHTTHQTINFPSDSSKISKANTSPVSKSNSIQSFEATNVTGNITVISSLGQNWYQQGIYGPATGNDNSWGWTFFDENPSSGFMNLSENVTQRENIYALLLDDGNNSNPISGATVIANVTYWTWDNVSYTNHTVPVQLEEDANRKGFYSGRFDFYGGTSYEGYGMRNCDGCHSSIYGFSDTQTGYFPGNYTVSIRAEATGKIKYTNLNFEVTPWGCEDCHGSGNRHRASADMDSACYICHGINSISGMSDAGNPHMNSAHRDIGCQECHTNKTLSSQTFTNVTFVPGGIDNYRSVPKYINNTMQLNGGKHLAVECTDCHNNLSLPGPLGGYGSHIVNGIVNNYDPSFASLEQFEDYYVINVTSSDSLNINLDWNSTADLGFYLYPPDFNPKNGIMPPYYDGASSTNKPEIYFNSAPVTGKWILQVYGYDLRYDFSGWNTWGGVLQPPTNYTVNSTYPIQMKDLPTTPECNNCHNSEATGRARTIYEIPDWNPGFAHVDTNGDGTLDIQCRMCHDSMHDIGIKTCQNCHTTAPTNHPISDPSFTEYTPTKCLACHGDPHRVTVTGGTCIACHSSPTGDNIYAAIDTASFGKHKNINTTDGNDNLTDNDCEGCHLNISNMMNRTLNVDTRICTDCHIAGNFSAPIINNHKPPKIPLSAGGKISTLVYCSICHNNSINKYIYSLNATVSHYGTNTSLVTTVNKTQKPKFGFMTQQDANRYNMDCNNCHSSSNSSYGNATLITTRHTGTSTCNQCHVDGFASDLHNNSLGLPLDFTCHSCHTTYADKFGAPNLTGLDKGNWLTCNGGSCHGVDITNSLDTLARHNVDRTKAGTGGSTDTVYLNNKVSLTVTKGAFVNITSKVNDAYSGSIASKVGGAEYYIDSPDPGQGKGIPMAAADGYYNAINSVFENVVATLDTSNLSGGTHKIYVRGMDIGKQWSAPKNATLIVQAFGYINGTVRNGTGVTVSGVYVSTTGANFITGSDGNYSLILIEGIYDVTFRKQPEYYDFVMPGVIVTPGNTTRLDPPAYIKKPTGMISGSVKIG